ncbi:MAG: hypothetical protein AABZ02_12435, partial [Bacteroidota bacterium]
FYGRRGTVLAPTTQNAWLPYNHFVGAALARRDAPNIGELSINSLPLQGTDFLRFVAWFSF